jgi:hypothetical protein
MISIPANINPKNKYDHKAFNASCIMQKHQAFLTTFSKSIRSILILLQLPSQHTTHSKPGKTQLGGLKLGFIKLGYQVKIFRVTVPDK